MPESNENIQAVEHQVSSIEVRLSIVEHRMNVFDRAHEMTPTRLTKLEQQFESMAKQLTLIGATLKTISDKQDEIGRKIAYAMGAAAVFIVIADKLMLILTGKLL